MYIAMNRFRVPTDNAAAFENVWLNRDSQLKDMEGFVEFHMLRGSQENDLILYASHTVWRSEEDFRAWTTSEAFREAHKSAGTTRKLHDGRPHFEGFTTIQHID